MGSLFYWRVARVGGRGGEIPLLGGKAGFRRTCLRTFEPPNDRRLCVAGRKWTRGGRGGPQARYFSTTLFRFASPSSKSLPIMLSMLQKTLISFEM